VKKRTIENPYSESLRTRRGRNEKWIMKKNAQVKVVKKKRAVFAEGGRKDECGEWSSLLLFTSFCPEIPLSLLFSTRYPTSPFLASSFSPQITKANTIP
jgi:hypothetical protein